jgi:hypothetical protein
MEGNFYVVPDPVKEDAKGQIARAYAKCDAESERYGACVELHHVNKNLEKGSCLEERLALRACIDKYVTLHRQHAVDATKQANSVQQQQQQKQPDSKS